MVGGVLSSCCMSMKPPPSPSSPSRLRRSTQVTSWPGKEGSWRRHLVIGMACIIMRQQHSSVANGAELAVESKKGSAQWSHQRRCEPWRLNSLETIVPENLPRPSAHRTWEKVNHSKHKDTASAPSLTLLTNIDKCFTM
ncbi:hypothetical protein ACET3Z_001096 [Daucus carota]